VEIFAHNEKSVLLEPTSSTHQALGHGPAWGRSGVPMPDYSYDQKPENVFWQRQIKPLEDVMGVRMVNYFIATPPVVTVSFAQRITC
jgi:hypothetical protein